MPVFVGHCVAAHIEFANPISAAKARTILARSAGHHADRPAPTRKIRPFVTPVESVGDFATFVSRVRVRPDGGGENGLGARLVGIVPRTICARERHLNAVQIAELLLNKGVS